MANNGYPKFQRGAFSHFSKDLKVVDYYLQAKAAEDQLEKASNEYEGAADVYSRSNGSAYELITSKLLEITTPVPGVADTASSKASAVATGIMRVKHATRTNSGTPIAQREIRDVLFSILPLFCTFDKDALDAAAAPLLTESKMLASAKSKAAGAKGSATVQFNRAISTWSGIFSDADFLSGMNSNAQSVRAYEEAKRFVEQWRNRARQFMVPVTTEGTAISSLPNEVRQVWATAYNKLGFDKIKKSDIFTPIKYSGVDSVQT